MKKKETKWDVDKFVLLFLELCDSYKKVMAGHSEHYKNEARKAFRDFLQLMRVESEAMLAKNNVDFEVLEAILDGYPGDFKDQMNELKTKMKEVGLDLKGESSSENAKIERLRKKRGSRKLRGEKV